MGEKKNKWGNLFKSAGQVQAEAKDSGHRPSAKRILGISESFRNATGAKKKKKKRD